MYIKKIVIEKNDANFETYDFCDNLNVVYSNDLLYNIIELLLGIEKQKKYSYDVRFLAIVNIDNIYCICGEKRKGEAKFNLSVYKENKEIDCLEEYYNLVFQNQELYYDLFFKQFKKQDYPHKLLKYKDLLKYYPNGDFAKLTNGYGTTRSFRGFITDYIKHFKPIKLRDNKELYLKLSSNGEFKVEYLDSDKDVFLSESENILYHYFSFVNVADFWTRAEKIRNLNFVSKPLFISNFLEFLDESINLTEILERTNKIGRQVIMFVPKEVHLKEYNVNVRSGLFGK